jgi:signal transduction histidine kinase
VAIAAEAKEITVRVPPIEKRPCLVLGDPTRLRQVVLNLVNNAIKFTPKRGRVDVCLRQSPSHAEIEVRDTGCGIAPEFLPHLFERFRQEDASYSRGHGGLGLGLAIVKSLVELHGGRVQAVSDGPGRGSAFMIRLPIPPARPGEYQLA